MNDNEKYLSKASIIYMNDQWKIIYLSKASIIYIINEKWSIYLKH